MSITRLSSWPAGLAVLMALGACATGGGDVHPAPGVHINSRYVNADLANLGKVAVLDFSEGNPDGGICRTAELAMVEGSVETGSGEIVADHIHARMAEAGFTMVDRARARETQLAIGEKLRQANGAELASETISRLGAGAVAMGCVAKYEDLSGSWLSADRPAHVSYGVAIISASGEVVWVGKFEKRQRSLFADLTQWRIFAAGGGVWLTADKLSGVGARLLVETMPRPR